MATLSVIIIAKNEADKIRQCLESVKWANEIIVLDSGSTDHTVDICREFTDKVYQTDWPGYGPQKNRALAKTSCDWVLSLDADEWLSAPLQNEIKNVIQKNECNAFQLPRQTSYCGKMIKYGNWRNDKVLCLFKKNSGKFSEDIVHEAVIVNGKINVLKNTLYHNSFTTLEDVINTMNNYSSLSADLKMQQGKKANLSKAIFHGLWTFIKSYFIKLGFLDGRAGFMLAVSAAEGSYYRYAKLMMMNK